MTFKQTNTIKPLQGLAVGLEEHVDDVWTLFAAVATHKYVISFCMGVELVSVSGTTFSEGRAAFSTLV